MATPKWEDIAAKLAAKEAALGEPIPVEVKDDVRPQHRVDGVTDAHERWCVIVGRDTPRSPQIQGQADGAVAELLALGRHRHHVGHEQLGHVPFVVVVDLRGGVDPTFDARAGTNTSTRAHRPGSATWIDRQLGTRAASPGASTSSTSSAARRSMPALASVA